MIGETRESLQAKMKAKGLLMSSAVDAQLLGHLKGELEAAVLTEQGVTLNADQTAILWVEIKRLQQADRDPVMTGRYCPKGDEYVFQSDWPVERYRCHRCEEDHSIVECSMCGAVVEAPDTCPSSDPKHACPGFDAAIVRTEPS